MRTKGKFKGLAAGLVAVGMLASCSVNDDIDEGSGDGQVRFTAGIGEIATPLNTPGSRAAGTEWGGTDKVGIFMVQGGTPLAGNKQYNVSNASTGAFAAASDADKIFYPQTGTVDFIAYYPWENGVTLDTEIEVTIGDQTLQPTFDLLYSDNATGKTKSASAVDLTFEHKLSKLVMNVQAGAGLTSGDLNGMIVTIKGMKTKNTFDLSTGSLGTPDDVADITPRTITTEQGFAASYDAIILPSAAIQNEGDYSVEFTIDPNGTSQTFTWKMDAGTGFESGNEYTYTVTITPTGVTATGTITQWTPNNKGDVTAE